MRRLARHLFTLCPALSLLLLLLLLLLAVAEKPVGSGRFPLGV